MAEGFMFAGGCCLVAAGLVRLALAIAEMLGKD